MSTAYQTLQQSPSSDQTAFSHCDHITTPSSQRGIYTAPSSTTPKFCIKLNAPPSTPSTAREPEPKSPPQIKLNMPRSPPSPSVAHMLADKIGAEGQGQQKRGVNFDSSMTTASKKKRDRSTSAHNDRNAKRLRRASGAAVDIVKDHVQYFDSMGSPLIQHEPTPRLHFCSGSFYKTSGTVPAIYGQQNIGSLKQHLSTLEKKFASLQQQLELVEEKAELDLSIRLTLEEIIECYFKLQDDELAAIRAASRESERLLLEYRADAYQDEAHTIEINLAPSVELQATVVERLIQKHAGYRMAYDALRKRMQAFDEKWSGLIRVETYDRAYGETTEEMLQRLRGQLASHEQASGHQTV